jgi:hypothetical protein
MKRAKAAIGMKKTLFVQFIEFATQLGERVLM